MSLEPPWTPPTALTNKKNKDRDSKNYVVNRNCANFFFFFGPFFFRCQRSTVEREEKRQREGKWGWGGLFGDRDRLSALNGDLANCVCVRSNAFITYLFIYLWGILSEISLITLLLLLVHTKTLVLMPFVYYKKI